MSFQTIDSDFTLTGNDIDALLGTDSSPSEDSQDSEESESGDDECGDPSGVVIWEWPAAIQCWLSNLLKTEWKTPDL